MSQGFPIVMEKFRKLLGGDFLNRRHWIFQPFFWPDELLCAVHLPSNDLMMKGVKIE
jgi:hypothetical protein